MKFKLKEKAKLDTRRKMWSHFGWTWVGKDGERFSDKNKDNGYGFFRNNHSLNCGCSMCRYQTFIKREERRKKRRQQKLEIKKLFATLVQW